MLRHLARRAGGLVRAVLFHASVPPLRRWLRGRWEGPGDIPPIGLVRFGNLRRLEPMSGDRGTDRGGPIDHYYIGAFMDQHARDIRGRVLEMTSDRPDLPSEAFDCVLLTQALQLSFDVRSAVATVHRVLRPGGVVLATVPGITPLHDPGVEPATPPRYWSFTALSARRLFEEHFDPTAIEVETFGNVLVAASFLHGLGWTELTGPELDFRDPDYEVVIALRARKTGAPA